MSAAQKPGIDLPHLLALLVALGAGGYCLYVAILIAWSLL